MDETPIKKETNYGAVSLFAGVIQIFFNNISLSIMGWVGLSVFLINIVAVTKAFRQTSIPKSKKLALVGLTLSAVMILLGFLGFQTIEIINSIFNYFYFRF